MALARLAKYGLKLGGGGRGASIRIYRFSPCIITPLEHLNVKMNLLSISWVRGIRMTPNYEVAHAAERIAEDSDLESESPKYPSLEATKEGEKPRVVVLGSGWAACRFLKSLNTKLYDVVCISPRNHMVFTPLLASTCVGTLEFRSVVEPVVRIQTALANDPNSYFYLATCSGIDTDKHELYCESVGDAEMFDDEPYRFKVAYDKLVIASGSEPLTFGIKGVKENAFFLREVHHAQEIRKKLLLNLML